MVKQIFKLSLEEKDFLDRIVSISGLDHVMVKEVLQSTLKMITIELYSGNNEIQIPYLCKLNLSSYEKLENTGVATIVETEAEPSQHLINEIRAINEGEITPTQQFTRQKIYKKIEEIVEK